MPDGINLPMLIGAAIIDSINPCAFGVLIFLLAYLTKVFKKPWHMALHGFVYTLGVFVTYLIAGLVLLPILSSFGKFSVISYVVISIIILIAGLIEIKDFFWYGKGFSLTIFPSASQRIKLYVKRISCKFSTAFSLGIFVALVELPCTGAVYLAVLTLMSLAGVTTQHISFLVLYNFIFVLPLFVIIFLMYKGVSAKKFEHWRQKHKALMRLITGLLLISMGLWMLFYVLG